MCLEDYIYIYISVSVSISMSISIYLYLYLYSISVSVFHIYVSFYKGNEIETLDCNKARLSVKNAGDTKI